MANPIFPVSNDMPQNLMIGVAGTYKNNLISFEPDAGGESIERPKYLSVPRVYSGCQMVVNQAQRDDLINFFENTILFGAVKFDWKDPFSNAVRVCKLKNMTDAPLNSVGTDYTLYEVSFDLEVLPS